MVTGLYLFSSSNACKTLEGLLLLVSILLFVGGGTVGFVVLAAPPLISLLLFVHWEEIFSAILLKSLVEADVGFVGCEEMTSAFPVENENCFPRNDVPVSLAVLPRFLFANSYISPNIPAKVFLRFFIVSSASSTTDV